MYIYALVQNGVSKLNKLNKSTLFETNKTFISVNVCTKQHWYGSQGSASHVVNAMLFKAVTMLQRT